MISKNFTLSYTSITTFLSCPLKFHFKYNLRKDPVVRGESRAFGIAMHEALEEMYTILSETGNKPSEDVYNKVYKKFLDSGVKNNLQDQKLYDEGRLILKTRLDSYSPDEKILGLEILFGYPVDNPKISVCTKKGTPLGGAMDKVFELDKETVVLLDYKTSWVALTDEEAKNDIQLSMYDYVVNKLYPNYKNIIIVLDYLRLSPVITTRTPEQRKNFEEFVDSVHDNVCNFDWSKVKPNLNEYCGWCDYRYYCDAYKNLVESPETIVRYPSELSQEELVDEWVKLKQSMKLLDSYKNDLDIQASYLVNVKGHKELTGKTKTLYKVQTNSVRYDSKTVYNELPNNVFLSMVTVNKNKLNKYLSNHPEIKEKIIETAEASYSTPYFRLKNRPK